MLPVDTEQFFELWNRAQAFYGKQPITDKATQALLVGALRDFSLPEISQAVMDHLAHSKYALMPAHIFEYWQKHKGETDEALSVQADISFRQIDSVAVYGDDIVCQDARAAVAFNTAFGKLNIYLSHTVSETPFLKRDFRNAYINTGTLKNERPEDHLITGCRSVFGAKTVQFAGDYLACRKIADQIFAGRNVIYAKDQVKALPKPENKPFTEAERQASKEKLDEVFNLLKSITTFKE